MYLHLYMLHNALMSLKCTVSLKVRQPFVCGMVDFSCVYSNMEPLKETINKYKERQRTF